MWKLNLVVTLVFGVLLYVAYLDALYSFYRATCSRVRGTGWHGGDLAADYIAKQVCVVWIEASRDNGTYLQHAPK